MLLNLLIYCVQASDGNPVHVCARCAAAQKRGASCAHNLSLEVATRGCVLSADALAGVFNPLSFVAGDDPNPDQVCSCKVVCIAVRTSVGSKLFSVCMQACGSAPGRLGLYVSRRLAEGAAFALLSGARTRICACQADGGTCSLLMASLALGGELRVRSDEADGTVVTAIVPVLLSGTDALDASVPAGAQTAPTLRRPRADESNSASLGGASAQGSELGSSAALRASEEDEHDPGFAEIYEPMPPAPQQVAESFDSLKQRGMLTSVMDLVRTHASCPACSLCSVVRARAPCCPDMRPTRCDAS
jgi:hypothetical protein